MIQNTIEKLQSMSCDDKNDKQTIDSAVKILQTIKKCRDERVDFEGWKETPMTLKDILDAIGLKKSNDKYVVGDSFLDAYVDLLEDDGMGYGARNGACMHAYMDNYDGRIKLWF